MVILQGHKFAAELSDGVLHVTYPARPDRRLEVRCVPRAACGGELWYLAGDVPLGVADRTWDTVVEVKRLTAARM